ncbi:MAG: DivIVA domain-containing protein [Candidatus Improbicoccus pseudotrichonymphae]|uniref:DivIVA domain-containing protein n=1 Tax=Candidatus Improbicoccus pseudotrichonymphae TaxID=3033792 RepID=A0AA48IAT5_9FIRM|nr:MAG: DivIVA domain-containing protein [Candidatus Improbicoccus pseudotrichonymphae]
MLDFDVKNIRFSKKIIGGYDSVAVDRFLDEVGSYLDEIKFENAGLKKKVCELIEKVRSYQEDEASIRKAILNSQKIADASLLDADIKAKHALREAGEKAIEIIDKTNLDISKKIDTAKLVFGYFNTFKSELIKKYEEQIDFLNKIYFEDIGVTEEKFLSLKKDGEKILEYVNENCFSERVDSCEINAGSDDIENFKRGKLN